MKQHDPIKFVREYEKALEVTMPLRNRVCLGQFVAHEDRSEETLCFSAILAIDGRGVAHIGNDGRGGCLDVMPMPKDGVMAVLSDFNREVEDLARTATDQPFYLESFLTALVWDTARNARTVR